jgi:hypothetical protein
VNGPRADIKFNDTYAGPRWRYGLQYRPLLLGGATPEDFIVFSDRASADPRCRLYGTVDFPRELTAQEVTSYQLVPFGQVS